MIFDARIQREAKALRGAGYDVSIVYVEDQEFFRSLPDPEQAWTDYNKHMEGIKTIRYFLMSRTWRFLPSSVNKMFQAIELFLKFTYAVIRNRANYYHCHDLTPAIFAWLGRTIYGAKLVYDAHELEVEAGGASESKKKRKRAYERFTVKNSALAITVNDYIADVMKENYGKEVKVVGNKPLYVAKQDLRPGLLKKEAGIPEDAKAVLYVGYMHLARGIDKMVEALRFLPDDIYFLIMGTGRLDEYKKILFEIADAEGVDKNRIRFVGPFPPSDVVKYLSGADVSVMLYQATTSNAIINAPNKLFQSVMARVPVVASANKSFPVFLYENPCGTIGETVTETDPEDIARGVMKVLLPENQNEFKKNADCFAGKVSWEQEAEKLVNAYAKI